MHPHTCTCTFTVAILRCVYTCIFFHTAPPIYYVPVLRAVDNCTPPQLTPPCTAAEYHLHVDQKALTDDRGTPMIGQAFAGPMSPAQVIYSIAF